MWKGDTRRLGLALENGLEIEAHGRIGVYEPQGQYQFYTDIIRPIGEGALYQEFLRLKSMLEAEGLFDADRKRPIPELPGTIGIVTSATGAALRDMLDTLNRRLPLVEVIVAPTPVQGDQAPAGIVAALNSLNKYEPDVILIGRGGGSIEDLWAFNTEVVARAIARSKIPVISAVGHEIDFTISDFVADLRAPTPSAAAEMVIGKKEEYMKDFQNFYDQLIYIIKARISDKRHRLQELISSHVFYEPKGRIRLLIQRVDECLARLQRAERHTLDGIDQILKGLAGKLNALSPLNILARGYSVTTSMKNKGVCKTYQDVAKGDVIQTRVANGKFLSEITEICS